MKGGRRKHLDDNSGFISLMVMQLEREEAQFCKDISLPSRCILPVIGFAFECSVKFMLECAEHKNLWESTLPISLTIRMDMDAEMGSEFDAEFTLAEVVEMESLYKGKMGDKPPNSEFYQELAAKFNNSVYRCGKSVIEWEQVAYWFQDRAKRDLKDEILSFNHGANVPRNILIDKSAAGNSALTICEEVKLQFPDADFNLAAQTYYKPRDVAATELSGLLYEAKSARDLAWYDVASFLNYRVMHSGELEVRVRFAGFDKNHDEWVNVKRGVRERSIPLEDSECEKVKVGDLVLCYRETEDLAVYRDARVIGIQRKTHDETEGCTCIFDVLFEFDFFEDQLRLNRLCGRPSA